MVLHKLLPMSTSSSSDQGCRAFMRVSVPALLRAHAMASVAQKKLYFLGLKPTSFAQIWRPQRSACSMCTTA